MTDTDDNSQQSPDRPRLVISKTSWHYRFLYWGSLPGTPDWYSGDPKDLCSYFWSIVGKTFFLGLLVVLSLIVSYVYVNALLSPFITWGVWWYLGAGLTPTTTWLGWMFVGPANSTPVHFGHFSAEILIWSLTLLWVYKWFTIETKAGQQWLAKREANKKPPSTFMLITKSYLRARKEKYCPLVEYEG